MRREERTVYNQLKKIDSEKTMYVEIPVRFTTEGKEAMKVLLYVKSFIALRINWSPIENGYTILYKPVYGEEEEKISFEQACMSVEQLEKSLRVTDTWWNGFKKQNTEEKQEKQEVEQTKTEEAEKPVVRLNLLTTHCDGTREWYDTNHEYLSEESAFHTGMAIMDHGYCSGFEIVKDTKVIFRQVKNSLPEYMDY